LTDTLTLTRSTDGTHYTDPDGGRWVLIRPEAWDLLQARLAAIKRAAEVAKAAGVPRCGACEEVDAVYDAVGVGDVPFSE
jgi:hypothetical protein